MDSTILIVISCCMAVGLLCFFFLSFRRPRLHRAVKAQNYFRISVIIPTCNNAKTLPALLADLQNQSIPTSNIICVDYGSWDGTKQLAEKLGAQVLDSDDTQERYISSPTQAQHVGAEFADGDMFLFLDANMRLSPDALLSLSRSYQKNQKVISIMPYHQMRTPFEQLSLFVDLFTAFRQGIGTHSAQQDAEGFFDSCVFISREDWERIYVSPAASQADQETLPRSVAAELGIPLAAVVGGDWMQMPVQGGLWSDSQLCQSLLQPVNQNPSVQETTNSFAGQLETAAAHGQQIYAQQNDNRLPYSRETIQYSNASLQEDLATNDISSRLLLGGNLIRYRADSLRAADIFRQNVACLHEPHKRTNLQRFLWLFSFFSMILSLISVGYGFYTGQLSFVIAGALFSFFVFLLLLTRSGSVGRYSWIVCLFYPIPLIYFFACWFSAPRKAEETAAF